MEILIVTMSIILYLLLDKPEKNPEVKDFDFMDKIDN